MMAATAGICEGAAEISDALASRGVRDRHVPGMLRRLAEAVKPRPRVRPSEWARRHIVLTREQTSRPGPFNPDIYPWGASLLDWQFDHPDELGMIAMKPGQIGFSLTQNIRTLCEVDTDPGPVLYMTTDDEEAKTFADEYFKPMLRGVPRLALAVSESAEDRRQQLHSFPFPGGRLIFVGSGSESKLVGKPFRRVRLDEFDVVEHNYPGDAWQAAKVRLTTYRGMSELSAWSHPKKAWRGIHKLWVEQSRQQPWVFDCPACGGAVEPLWKLVRYKGVLDDGGGGKPDPASAVLACPSCAHEISDSERARAVWPARLGGSGRGGRFESRLAPGEAARRQYGGPRIHRLCDPEVSLVELAIGHCSCTSEAALEEFFGKQLGEEYESARAVLDAASVKKAMEGAGGKVVVPGGRRGVHFIAAGADVQAPRDNPLIYAAAAAFAANGHCFVTHLDRLSGFAAWHEWLAGVSVELSPEVTESTGHAKAKTLGVSVAGIDDRYESGQVKDNCRAAVYSAASSARVEMVPLGFAASSVLNADNPYILRAEKKREHPTRPELGRIDMFDLHRHSWVDRVVRMLQGGVVHVLCATPPDLEAHLLSQVMTPKKQPHTNWQAVEMEWDLSKDRRDDWLMAIVYAVAAAAIKRGLDRLHLSAAEPIADGPRIVAPALGIGIGGGAWRGAGGGFGARRY